MSTNLRHAGLLSLLVFCGNVMPFMVRLERHDNETTATFTGRRPRIFIVPPTAGPGTSPGAAELEADMMAADLAHRLPCAQITTYNDINAMLSWDRMKTLLTANPDGSRIQDIAGSMGADLIIALSFNGTPTNAVASGSALNVKHGKAVARASATASGGTAEIDALEQLGARLGKELRDYCPLLGTITYERKIDQDSSWTVTEGDAVRTTEESTHDLDAYTITLVKEGLKSYLVTSKGTSTSKTRFEARTVRTDINCFRRGADGVVRDNDLATHVNQTIINRRVFDGKAADSLLALEFKLEPVELPGVPETWTLSATGGVMGNGDGFEEDEMQGGCGSFKERKPGAMPGLNLPTFVSGILFGVSDLIEKDTEIKGVFQIPSSPGITETVTIKLSRK